MDNETEHDEAVPNGRRHHKTVGVCRWSYGYCAGFDGDGDWKWIADASRGEHHLKATGAALEEALLELWEAVCGLPSG